MIEFSHILYEIIVILFFIYGAALFLINCWIGTYAFGALKRYRNQHQYVDYNLIATDPNVPSFSIIAPAYNEGKTIVVNVRSLLSLYYPNLEIIIVNDGSKDDSIAQLINAYNLEKVDYFVQETIPTNEVLGVYKSKNRAFQKLIVVDKVNGGKADALNVGINISSGKYIVCIDVDCILEQDALLKLAKPFLDQTEERVIACGGVIRIANNCKVENGKVTDVNIPSTWLGRFQALEYIRAFILGRMAWSRASGLILISGAFGAFDKAIVMACGGYDRNTVGEDMELVVRMRRYMEDHKQKYRVINIPDPLCWTEVPESKEILKKQRNRWMRGTIETLWKHRKLIFNPKYGNLGKVSLPFWFFFEFLGPVIEFLGYILFILFLVLGIINWSFFLILLALVLASGILYSIYAILVDLLTDQVYTKRKDLTTLLATAILEPFFFHIPIVLAGVSGVRDYFRKNVGWGEMKRQGFRKAKDKADVPQLVKRFLSWGLKRFTPISITFLILFFLSVGVEIFWYYKQMNQVLNPIMISHIFLDNLIFAGEVILVVGLLFFAVLIFSPIWSKRLSITLFGIVFTFQFVLFLYFAESKNLLGADLFFYTTTEILHILRSSGLLNLTNIALLVVVLLVGLAPLFLAANKSSKKTYLGIGIFVFSILLVLIPVEKVIKISKLEVLSQAASVSKWSYFFKSNLDVNLAKYPFLQKYFANSNIDFSDQISEYPFLRTEDTPDLLGPYLNKTDNPPNLVLLIIEGLGHSYSSSDGYIGNFTPYLDSLKKQSLYWEHNLSSSGRTFSVLPTVLGSLPFAYYGFLEQEKYALHFNLWNVLKKNSFKTGFYYGGNADFDFMSKYVKASSVDVLVDQNSFAPAYKLLPSSNGESWGYDDQSVLSKMLEDTKVENQPYFNVLLTLSTHSPFHINNEAYYHELVEKQINKLKLVGQKRELAIAHKKQLATVMNIDEALKRFFEQYRQRKDFDRTIFLITGDHSMPEIPMENKISRYHVPLLIYSPLLNKTETFKQIVSHFDIAPTILSYYRTNYGLNTPKSIAWLGKGLSEGASKSSNGIPIMQSKYQLEDYVLSDYHLSRNGLYKIDENFNEETLKNPKIENELKKRFYFFDKKNKKFANQNALFPDLVYNQFFNREN